MKMVVGLVVVLVAAFALPSAFASSEIKDVITREAYEKLVNSGAMEGVAMTKTIISNPVLEEALVTYSKNILGGSILNCGETCLMDTCYTSGCSCGAYRVCTKNSLQGNNNKAVKDVITRDAYENLVKSGAIEGIAMTKTIVSNSVLEEALVTYSKNKLGGSIFNCGETCIMGTCYTPGCSCVYGACSKNSLAAN